MPTEIICSNDKNSFALQQKEKNNIALLNYKWIFYNQDRVWHLIFDIDKKYKLGEIKEFLQKINTIPPSLALAQAAIESGWGKSRFTKEANNIF